MFRKILSFILPLVLFMTFGISTSVNAAPFTPSGSMQVLNLDDCNLSVMYNAEKMALFPITVDGKTSYFIGSLQAQNVFLRASCDQPLPTIVSTPARAPFWTGTRPDYNQTNITMVGAKKSGMQDGSGALIYTIENKQNPSKSIVLVYNYNTSDYGNWLDVYTGLFASQAGITSNDLQLRYINDPVYPSTANQAPVTSTPAAQPSPTNNQTPSTEDITTKSDDIKLDEKVFTFNAAKYTSCKGKTGKYLNGNGEVIKSSQVPRRATLIKADPNGIVLSSENDYIKCVKNAKPYGVVSCAGNVGNTLSNRGQKVKQYIRGSVYYASPEFGNIYISPKAGISCTENQFQLAKIMFQS